MNLWPVSRPLLCTAPNKNNLKPGQYFNRSETYRPSQGGVSSPVSQEAQVPRGLASSSTGNTLQSLSFGISHQLIRSELQHERAGNQPCRSAFQEEFNEAEREEFSVGCMGRRIQRTCCTIMKTHWILLRSPCRTCSVMCLDQIRDPKFCPYACPRLPQVKRLYTPLLPYHTKFFQFFGHTTQPPSRASSFTLQHLNSVPQLF